MTNFGEWKDQEFNCIYKRFEQAQNRQLEREKNSFCKLWGHVPIPKPPIKLTIDFILGVVNILLISFMGIKKLL